MHRSNGHSQTPDPLPWSRGAPGQQRRRLSVGGSLEVGQLLRLRQAQRRQQRCAVGRQVRGDGRRHPIHQARAQVCKSSCCLLGAPSFTKSQNTLHTQCTAMKSPPTGPSTTAWCCTWTRWGHNLLILTEPRKAKRWSAASCTLWTLYGPRHQHVIVYGCGYPGPNKSNCRLLRVAAAYLETLCGCSDASIGANVAGQGVLCGNGPDVEHQRRLQAYTNQSEKQKRDNKLEIPAWWRPAKKL